MEGQERGGRQYLVTAKALFSGSGVAIGSSRRSSKYRYQALKSLCEENGGNGGSKVNSNQHLGSVNGSIGKYQTKLRIA